MISTPERLGFGARPLFQHRDRIIKLDAVQEITVDTYIATPFGPSVVGLMKSVD